MARITNPHLIGFAVGIGSAAVGFYLYKKNEPAVDEWLRRQGISFPHATLRDYKDLTLEDLVAEKERLEDLIAEREYAALSPAESDDAVAEKS